MTYITSLSLDKQNRRRIYWNNQVLAAIVDLKNNEEFHLIDFPDGHCNPKLYGDSNELKNSKVLASGLIGAWLHQCVVENSTEVDLDKVFANYSERCENKYVSIRNSAPEYYGLDSRRIFYMEAHLLQEEKKFEASAAIYPFLAEEDRQKIKTLTEKYRQYIHNKYRELYPPRLETVLSYFDGTNSIGFKCIRLYLQKMDEEDTLRRKYPSVIPYYAEEEKSQILFECNCVDFSILRGRNNAIFEEIKTGLEQRQQQEDKLRYIHTFLTRLRDISTLVYPINEIDWSRKRIAIWKGNIEKGVKKDNCMALIENIEKEISIMQVRSDELFSMPNFGQIEYKEAHHQILDEEDYARKFMTLYLDFACRLDSLLMYYGIDLLEIENEQAVYLCPPQEWPSLGGDEFYLTIPAAKKYYEKLPKREFNKQMIEAIYTGGPMPVQITQDATQDDSSDQRFEMTSEDWCARYESTITSKFNSRSSLISHINKLRLLYMEAAKKQNFNRTGFLRDNIFWPKTPWLGDPYKFTAKAIRDLFNDDKFSDSAVSKAKKKNN